MNIYKKQIWPHILSTYPRTEDFNISLYYKILSRDFPDFITEYASVPSMQRLKGVGLLCGTDWTKLYQNRFYYSRLDHSIGVALIIWNFTHSKIQTLSGLFHDISTPVFSHVADFRKGDALTQTATENETENFIKNDAEICQKLNRDGIKISEICDYHIYPIADNERPCLSADRLEYMFPSGAALHGNWTLSEVKNIYSHIKVLQNEKGLPELGFDSIEAAEIYTEKFCETGHILQLNENKLCLQLLAKITEMAIQKKILKEEDFYNLSETQVMNLFEKQTDKEFLQLYKTYRNMEKIEHTDAPLENHFSISLQVKQRYINPLVEIIKSESNTSTTTRISEISPKASKIISDFLAYSDTKYGCVKIQKI